MGMAEHHRLLRRQHFISFTDMPIHTFSIPGLPTDIPSFTLLDPTFVDPGTTAVPTPTTNIGGCMGCTVATPTTTSTSTPSTTSSIVSTASSTSSVTPTTSSTSSTSSSSSVQPTTSSTTPIAVPVSTSSTAPPTTTTPTITSTPPVQYSTSTDTVYHSISASSTVSRTPSASVTPKSASGTSSGVMIGGICAAAVCGLGIIAALIYLIRRCKNSRTDDEFDPDTFRRQSTVLPDGPMPPRPWDSMDSGSKARPPTMIERRMVNNGSPVYGQYGQQRGYAQPPSPGPFAAYAPQAPARSFTPGQVVSPPPSATSAAPFFSPQAYDGQAQMLPSPTVSAIGHYDSAYDDRGELVRKPSAAYAPAGTTLARQPSLGNPVPAPAVVAPPVPGVQDPHYVDLDRSSVTPFQAAQYAEISQRLNDSVSHGPSQLRIINETPLPSPTFPDVKKGAEAALPESENGHDPSFIAVSPFADSAAAPPVPEKEVVHEEMEEIDVGRLDTPSPAFIEHERIASMPPVLPERPFSSITMSDFPMPSTTASSPLASKPVVSAETIPAATMSTVGPSMPVLAPLPVQNKRPDTVYTMYDPEDAYGGI